MVVTIFFEVISVVDKHSNKSYLLWTVRNISSAIAWQMLNIFFFTTESLDNILASNFG
jgi:hypothetical protein